MTFETWKNTVLMANHSAGNRSNRNMNKHMDSANMLPPNPLHSNMRPNIGNKNNNNNNRRGAAPSGPLNLQQKQIQSQKRNEKRKQNRIQKQAQRIQRQQQHQRARPPVNHTHTQPATTEGEEESHPVFFQEREVPRNGRQRQRQRHRSRRSKVSNTDSILEELVADIRRCQRDKDGDVTMSVTQGESWSSNTRMGDSSFKIWSDAMDVDMDVEMMDVEQQDYGAETVNPFSQQCLAVN